LRGERRDGGVFGAGVRGERVLPELDPHVPRKFLGDLLGRIRGALADRALEIAEHQHQDLGSGGAEGGREIGVGAGEDLAASYARRGVVFVGGDRNRV